MRRTCQRSKHEENQPLAAVVQRVHIASFHFSCLHVTQVFAFRASYLFTSPHLFVTLNYCFFKLSCKRAA